MRKRGIPPIETVADAPKAMAAVLASVSQGHISPADGETIATMIETWVRSFEATKLSVGCVRWSRVNAASDRAACAPA